jgi:ATP-binding cassette, subfamily B, multidrug efflux pump
VKPLRRLLSYYARYKARLALGWISVAGFAGFALLKPLIIGQAVDELVVHFSRAALARHCFLLVAVAAIEGGFRYLQRWLFIGVSRYMEFDIRRDLYAHLQKLPLRFFDHHRTGDLMSRITNDLASIRNMIGPALMLFSSSVLVVVGAFFMMFRTAPFLAMTVTATVPLLTAFVKVMGDRTQVKVQAIQNRMGQIAARVRESFVGIRTIRAFAQEANQVRSFQLLNREYLEENQSLVRLTALMNSLLRSSIGMVSLLVFVIGCRKMLAGSMSLGDFVAFQFYLGRLIWPLSVLGWILNLFQRGMAGMRRLAEIWDEPMDERMLASGRDVAVHGVRPSLEIRNLSFSHDGTPILQGINLIIRPGEVLGIVGRTGSGKSTLLALIAGLYDPPPGTIFVAGHPVESYSVQAIRALIGMVPQETFLFADTLAENIRFGRDTANDREILESAARAALEADLAALPRGIETVVGERGVLLSGGQKQRVAIARALVRDPLLLILDDSLSAVDPNTERHILRSLERFKSDRTVLIASHRLSAVQEADRIIVLDGGRVIECGRHDELLARGGYYAEQYRRQAIEAQLAGTL